MEARFSSQSAGYLLGKFGLLALLAILLLAAWIGQVIIVILLGLVLSAAVIARLWSRVSLANVQCQRIISEDRAFPGENIELKLRLVNNKLLPLPWVQIEDEIPYIFNSPEFPLRQGDELLNKADSGFISKGASLLWYTGVSWRYRLHCRKRGYYKLGPLTVSSGDIFGFYPRSRTEPQSDHIIVYPVIYPVSKLGLPSLHPLGDTTAERRIFEDPSRTIGVRDYTFHDSLKHVHWKATARQQKLQIKVFEPTTTLKVALFIVVESFTNEDSFNEEDFEMGISAAASLANHITKQGSQVGLFVNSCLADSGQSARILIGSGENQLVCILEGLAKVTPRTSNPVEEFFRSQQRNIPWGTTIVFVVSRPSRSLTSLITDIISRGYKVHVCQVGNQEEAEKQNDVYWHNVMRPEEFLKTRKS